MSKMTLAEFADKLDEIMPILMREFMKKHPRDFEKEKLTMSQIFILFILSRHGRMKMTELSNMLHVTTAATTGMVDRLVKNSYVERMSDPEDRRIIRIDLTRKGANSIKRVAAERKKVTMKIFSVISEKERQEYLSILQRIKENLTKGE